MMRALLLASLLGACGTSTGPGAGDDDPGAGWGEGFGTPEYPVPSDKGPYAAVSTIDLTVEAILPQQAEAIVATLRDFSTNPAHSLITLADKEGVPAVATIYDALPSALTDKLEGWINGEVNKVKINGQPISDYTNVIVGYADTALSKFAVDSELTIKGQGQAASNRLTAVDFNPAGFDVKITIPDGVVGDILTQNPTVSLAEGGVLTFGEQHFGLNYGEYAWQGINMAVQATTGKDIRTTLGDAINCPNLAQNISDKCVAFVCVGHKSEIQSICEGGLDALVDTVHEAIASQRLEALHFASGTAKLVDDDQDGVADRIVDGSWDAELNLGLGLRHAPSSFTAAR